MKRKSETVSFRLPQDMLALLDKQCNAFSTSRGDWARASLINKLLSAEDEAERLELDQLRTLVEAVANKVQLHEKKLARLLFLILTQVANKSEDEARTITLEQFLRHI